MSAQGMAGADDFLALCVARAAWNPVLEEIRERSSSVVMALYRLVKNCLVHAPNNETVLRGAADAEGVIRDFAATTGGDVSLTFFEDAVFVSGQLLRASRGVYESARELGALFARGEVSELRFQGTVTAQNLLDLGVAVSTAREGGRKERLLQTRLPNITLKRAEVRPTEREAEENLTPEQQALRLYAAALVVLRQFTEAVASGKNVLPHRLKRMAQRFVSLSEKGDSGFVAMSALASAHRDDAGRAVQTALLALLIGRRITDERAKLARLVMAAFMAQVGRVRLVAETGLTHLVELPRPVECAVPATASGLCIASGGVNAANALRAVVLKEAAWLEREPDLGPLYGNQLAPTLQARIIVFVRHLLAYLAPMDGSRALAPVDALERALATCQAEPPLRRLLVSALGLIPAGSVVEFESGEWGVVVGPSENPDALQRPCVKLVTDRSGRVLAEPTRIDLGVDRGRSFPGIARVVDATEQRVNVMRTLVG